MNTIKTGPGDCEKIRTYIDSYLNNELLIETNHEVLGHIEFCAGCSEILRDRSLVKARLKSAVLNQAVPADLQDKIQKGLRKRRADGYRRMLAAAALLVLGAGGWGAMYFWERARLGAVAPGANVAESISPHDAELLKVGLDDHVHCALDSRMANRIFTDSDMVQALGPDFAGLVSLVRDKTPPDLHVVSGHRCQFNGRQYVHLVMRNDQTVLSVLLTKKNAESFQSPGKDPSGPVPYIREARMQELEIAGFEAGDFLAFIVSNLPAPANLGVASDLAPGLRDFLAGTAGKA